MATTFLKAQWRMLAMANYRIEPGLLKPFVPHGTELDFWNNTCYVSLVGFMFVDTRVKGLRIPFHVNFEEVNLRFYVKRKEGDAWKRGVVFIKEIVPRKALTLVARLVYNEPYVTMPMSHGWAVSGDTIDVSYSWKSTQWNSIQVIAEKKPVQIAEGSEQEFITEHYWGYTKINSHRTREYGVEHPRWNIFPTLDYSIKVDFKKVYGDDFAFLSTVNPVSVFLAEGSEIEVKGGSDV